MEVKGISFVVLKPLKISTATSLCTNNVPSLNSFHWSYFLVKKQSASKWENMLLVMGKVTLYTSETGKQTEQNNHNAVTVSNSWFKWNTLDMQVLHLQLCSVCFLPLTGHFDPIYTGTNVFRVMPKLPVFSWTGNSAYQSKCNLLFDSFG